MKLYIHPASGHAHRATAMIDLLNIDCEIIILDLLTGEHQQPEFLKLNPLGQVPTLVDGDVVIRDSTAILTYLALKFDSERTWLPEDPILAAHVQSWLATSVKEIFEGPCGARITKFFGYPMDYDTTVEKTHSLIKTLFEPHLGQNEWLVGDAPTIADIANYGYLAMVEEAGVSIADYPNLRAWIARVETLNGFKKMIPLAQLMGQAAE